MGYFRTLQKHPHKINVAFRILQMTQMERINADNLEPAFNYNDLKESYTQRPLQESTFYKLSFLQVFISVLLRAKVSSVYFSDFITTPIFFFPFTFTLNGSFKVT